MPPRRRFLVPLLIGGVLAVAALLALLTLQLGEIRDQRDIAKRQENRVIALFRAAAPTARRARAAQDEVIAGLSEAADLVGELRRSGSPRAIAAAGRIARALERARAPGAIAAGGNLADALQRSGAPAAIADTGELARSLTRGNRVGALIDRATTLTGRVSELTGRALAAGTVDDVDATRQLTARLELLATRLDATTRRTLDILTQSLTVQRSLGAVARETLRHVQSIDTRLGGAP
jgi:hypothetical protein